MTKVEVGRTLGWTVKQKRKHVSLYAKSIKSESFCVPRSSFGWVIREN